MSATRNILAVLTAVAAVAALAGCGGDEDGATAPIVRPAATKSADAGPYADLSGRQLMNRATAAMRSASSLTVDLRSTDDTGAPMHLTAALTTSGKCAARAKLDGDDLQIIRTGKAYFMKADSGFWKSKGGRNGSRMAGMLAGKWLKLPARVADSGFDDFCDLGTLLASVDAGVDEGAVKKGQAGTYHGRPVVALIQTTSEDTTTYEVAASGAPYILKAFTPGDASNEATFTGFGQSPHISAPPPGETVDISAFGDLDGFSV